MSKKENNAKPQVSKYTKNIEKDLAKTDKELSAALEGKRMFEKLNESEYANRYSKEVSRLRNKINTLIPVLAANEVRDEMQSEISSDYGSLGGRPEVWTEEQKADTQNYINDLCHKGTTQTLSNMINLAIKAGHTGKASKNTIQKAIKDPRK